MSDLLDLCESKHQGNPESVAAWRHVSPTVRTRQREILELIAKTGTHGATAKELAARLGVQLNTISGRISELKQMGLIAASGRRRDRGAVVCAVAVMLGKQPHC